MAKNERVHFLVSALDHSCVLESIKNAALLGHDYSLIPHTDSGNIDIESIIYLIILFFINQF